MCAYVRKGKRAINLVSLRHLILMTKGAVGFLLPSMDKEGANYELKVDRRNKLEVILQMI